MPKGVFRVTLILLLLLLATVAGVLLEGPPARAPVGAVLYLWYGGPGSSTGPGTPGWNSTVSPGGGAVVDRPTIGYYASDSNQTFKTQVDQMQGLGLSFAVVSWWGPYAKGEAGAINKATLDLFRYLKGTDSDFKVAIMVDSFPSGSNISMSQVYSYVYGSFAGPYAKWYFDWQSRPLLVTFNPARPLYNDTRFTSREIGNYACVPAESCPNKALNSNLDWIWWDAPAQYFSGQAGAVNATNDEGQPVISPDGEVTIVPRIDSYFDRGYSGSYLRFDPNLSQGLYQEQWSYVLGHSSEVKLVIIYSWNEYHERTAIEPHVDATAAVGPSYLANLTASYISELS
ncbi:MAG: hypothetical protein JRN28_00895 [Nitrososphaerota archaeon]|nr:hypothetical protein [Nitrososphaerota archaeon]